MARRLSVKEASKHAGCIQLTPPRISPSWILPEALSFCRWSEATKPALVLKKSISRLISGTAWKQETALNREICSTGQLQRSQMSFLLNTEYPTHRGVIDYKETMSGPLVREGSF
jgi:hypothetical protein